MIDTLRLIIVANHLPLFWRIMNNKTPSIISVIVTIILLVLTAIVILFSQLLAMNGYSERVGTISLAISFLCQVASIIVAAILTSRLTRRFIEKSNWSRGLAGAAGV